MWLTTFSYNMQFFALATAFSFSLSHLLLFLFSAFSFVVIWWVNEIHEIHSVTILFHEFRNECRTWSWEIGLWFQIKFITAEQLEILQMWLTNYILINRSPWGFVCQWAKFKLMKRIRFKAGQMIKVYFNHQDWEFALAIIEIRKW